VRSGSDPPDGDHGAVLLTVRFREMSFLSAPDPAAAAPLCQRRETGGLSVALKNSAERNIPARNRAAVGRAAVGRAARNSGRAAPVGLATLPLSTVEAQSNPPQYYPPQYLSDARRRSLPGLAGAG
jgi:hypothetical protein